MLCFLRKWGKILNARWIISWRSSQNHRKIHQMGQNLLLNGSLLRIQFFAPRNPPLASCTSDIKIGLMPTGRKSTSFCMRKTLPTRLTFSSPNPLLIFNDGSGFLPKFNTTCARCAIAGGWQRHMKSRNMPTLATSGLSMKLWIVYLVQSDVLSSR